MSMMNDCEEHLDKILAENRAKPAESLDHIA